MLKLSAGCFVGAWAQVLLIHLSGHLHWDNRLLWVPMALLAVPTLMGASAWEYDEERVPLLVLAVAGFGSLLMYAVFYVFLFALGGH